MNRWIGASLLAALAVLPAAAQVTPLSEPLPEGREITITCELKTPPREGEVPVLTSAKSREGTLGTYHYKLYLPEGYHREPQRRYPVMFTMSPGGGGGAGKLMPYLKANRYVVVSLVEARNGPWEPIVGNFLAAHDDLIQRVRIQEGLKMATGFSGGARGSSVFVQCRPGFGGLIMQGAAAASDARGNYHVEGIKRNPAIACALLIGTQDSNAAEIPRLKNALGSSRLRVWTYEAGHTAPPQELLEEALRWIETQIYEEGPAVPALRPVYLQRFNDYHDRYRAATDPWARYQAGAALLRFATQRGLAADPALAGKLRETHTELERLRLDPKIAREAQAADALRRLQEQRDKMPDPRWTTECQNLIRLYPGTEAAATAQKWLTSPPR